MLSKEIIEKNISDLSEEQINKILSLNEKDEKNILKSEREKISKEYAKTFGSKVGIEVEENSTFENVISSYKHENAEKYKNEIAEKEKEIELLKSGVDEAAQKTIQDLQNKFQKSVKKIEELTVNHQKELSERDNTYKSKYIDSEFNSVVKGMNFKKELEDTKDIVTKSIVFDIKQAYEFDLDGDKVIIRDKNTNNILQNDDLTEKTIEQLFESKAAAFLDKGRNKTGTGISQNKTENNNNSGFILNARTKDEATQQIQKYLLESGLTKTDDNFRVKTEEIYKENFEAISKLPTN